jgi:hypothetical protein
MICPFPVPVNQLFRSPFTPSLAFQLQSHQPNYSRLDKRGRWSPVPKYSALQVAQSARNRTLPTKWYATTEDDVVGTNICHIWDIVVSRHFFGSGGGDGVCLGTVAARSVHCSFYAFNWRSSIHTATSRPVLDN